MNPKICIVGLGYVGLPVATAFGKKFNVFGFDINKKRVKELKNNYDCNEEISAKEIKKAKINFSSNPTIIKKANFIIIAAPTPVDKENQPDLILLKRACQLVGQNLRKNSLVVFESTVYPGTTEEICIPILEKESDLKYKKDFKVAYSPERINPGDKKHALEKVIKIVAGCDKATLKIVSQAYQKIIKAGVFEAQSIKVAEAAKIIENIQRDLNIALMNELKMIFYKLKINIKDVLIAAKTKWNFLDFHPGFVGGHCIGVNSHYLAYKAKVAGHNPKLILASRKINDQMIEYEFKKIIKKLKSKKIKPGKAKILILGATFKPNVKDLRNSKIKDLINYLKNIGCQITVCEPMVPEKKKIFNCQNIKFKNINFDKYNFIIRTVNHNVLRKLANKKVYNLFE